MHRNHFTASPQLILAAILALSLLTLLALHFGS
jgi:hypothetical protein